MPSAGEVAQTQWAEKRSSAAEPVDSSAAGVSAIGDGSYCVRPFTAPSAALPRLLGQRLHLCKSDSDRLRQLYGKTTTKRPSTAQTLGRQFGTTEGVLKPTARLAHTQAQTMHKDRECLAEEWQNLLCQIDPNHPEYVQIPLADTLDPYALAYTSLLLKEAAAGALPVQDENGTIQMQYPGARRSSSKRDLQNNKPTDVTQSIALLDDLLDGAISRVRRGRMKQVRGNGEMKPSGRGRYDFVSMSHEERIGVLKRVYGKGAGPRRAVLSHDTRMRLYDHLRLGKHMADFYDEESQDKMYVSVGVQCDGKDFIGAAVEKERQGQEARQREAVALALKRERHAAEKRLHEAVAQALAEQLARHEQALAEQLTLHEQALAEQLALHEQALAQLQAVHETALAQLRGEHEEVITRERDEAKECIKAVEVALKNISQGGDHDHVIVDERTEVQVVGQIDTNILGGLSPSAVVAWMKRMRAANTKLREQLLGSANSNPADSNTDAAALAALQQVLQSVQNQLAGTLAQGKGAAAAAGDDCQGTDDYAAGSGADVRLVSGVRGSAGDSSSDLVNGEVCSPAWLQNQLLELANETQELLGAWAQTRAKLNAWSTGQQSRDVQVVVLDLSSAMLAPAQDDGPPPLPPIASLMELLSHAGRDTADACSMACATCFSGTITQAALRSQQGITSSPPLGISPMLGKAPVPPDPSAVWPGTPCGTEGGGSITDRNRCTRLLSSESGRPSHMSDGGKIILYDQGTPGEPSSGGKLRPSSSGPSSQRGGESPLTIGMTSPSGPLSAAQFALSENTTAANSSAQVDGAIFDRASSTRPSRASSAHRPLSARSRPASIAPPSAQTSSSTVRGPGTPGRLTRPPSTHLHVPQLPLSASAIQASYQAGARTLPSSSEVQAVLCSAMVQVRRLLDTSNALMSVAEQMLEAQQADVIEALGVEQLSRALSRASSQHLTSQMDSDTSGKDSDGQDQTPLSVEAPGTNVHTVEQATADEAAATTASEGARAGSDTPLQTQFPAAVLSPSREVVAVLLSQVRSMQGVVGEHLGAVLVTLDQLSKEHDGMSKVSKEEDERSRPASATTYKGTNTPVSMPTITPTIGVTTGIKVLDLFHHLHLVSKELITAMQQLAGLGEDVLDVVGAGQLHGMQTMAAHLDELMAAFNMLYSSGVVAMGGGEQGIQTDAVVLWSLQPILQGYLLNLGLWWQLWTRGIHVAWSHAREAAAKDLKRAKDLAVAQSTLLLYHIAHLEETAQLAAAAAEAAAAAAEAAARQTPTVDQEKAMEAVFLHGMCDSLQHRLDALTSEHQTLQVELEQVKIALNAAQIEVGLTGELKARLLVLEKQLAEREAAQSPRPTLVDRGVSPDQPPVTEKGWCGC